MMVKRLCAKCHEPYMEFDDVYYENLKMLSSGYTYCEVCNCEILRYGRIELLMEKVVELMESLNK